MKIVQSNLKFGDALEAMKNGAKIRCPEWEGYWFKRGGRIVVKQYDGNEVMDPWLKETIFREDWQIVDDSLSVEELIN